MFKPDSPSLLWPGCVVVTSLSLSFSGSPCRIRPGGAGQLSASLYILHPGHLCVCGTALHPQQREEVHHLWRLPVPGLWVFSLSVYAPPRLHPSPAPHWSQHLPLPPSLPPSPGLCIMIAASIYTDRFHKDENDGWYGHCFILAWISFALTFISSITYFVLRKKNAWEGH